MTELPNNENPVDCKKHSDRRTNDASKTISKDVDCGQRDIKLREAEKTIANKDVIIKMLQGQVKKLEESYKQNLTETENFRYKFCLAVEQVKRLRTCPKSKRKEEKIKELHSNLDKWKQQCDELMDAKDQHTTEKRNFGTQKMENFENFMTAHYKLLQTLVEKLNGNNCTAQVGDIKKPYNDQIKTLHSEVELKSENTNLHIPVPVSMDRFISVKDSVSQNKLHLQKMSEVKHSLEEASEISAEKTNTDSRRISFQKTKEQFSQVNEEAHTDFENEVVQQVIESLPDEERIPPSALERGLLYCMCTPNETAPESGADLGKKSVVKIDDTIIRDIKTPQSEKSARQTSSLNEKTQSMRGSFGSSFGADIDKTIKKEFDNISTVLKEINDKVGQVVHKQAEATNELQLLKGELSVSQKSTLECNEQLSQLKTSLAKQNETFLANLEQNQNTTSNLNEVNEKIQHDMNELKTKIETLLEKLNELKDICTTNEDSDSITIEKCKFEILKFNKNDDETAMSVCEPTTNTECEPEEKIITKNEQSIHGKSDKLDDQYSNLKKENKEKDQQIKCINALISCYTKAQSDIRAMHPQKIEDTDDQRRKRNNEDIHKYIDKVRNENNKLKVTISSVINHLNLKMKQLGTADEDSRSRFCLCLSSEEAHRECDCRQSEVSSVSSNSLATDAPHNDGGQLQIEDIYNVVRSTRGIKYKHSSTSCFCNKHRKTTYSCTYNGSQTSDSDNIEDIYNSVICACSSSVKKSTHNVIVCEPKCDSNHLLKTTNADICSGKDDNDCSGESLVTNLQTYVNYLNEQLAIISSIENQIEDLRVDIKTPKM